MSSLGGKTILNVGRVKVPAAVVIEILPVCAPSGTTTTIAVADSTVKSVAGVDPNSTAVAPVKSVPTILTEVPTPPSGGVTNETVGIATTVKADGLVAVPPSVVTEILPVEAPRGTLTSSSVSEITAKFLAL